MTQSNVNELGQHEMQQQQQQDQRPSTTNGEPKVNGVDPKDILSKPIPGPKQNNPDYMFETDYEQPMSVMGTAGRFVADLVRKPAFWIRENIVLPNKGPKYYYYHRKYPRALPIDECYMDDLACIYEANIDYQRTYKVDRATLELLRARRDGCIAWFHLSEGKHNIASEQCNEVVETFKREETNYFTKYGDLPANAGVMHAYNKQKARMIVDRRLALQRQQQEAEAKQAA